LTETLHDELLDLDSLRKELLANLSRLASSLGWTWNGKPRITGLAKLLTSSLCERQIDYRLRHHEYEDAKFDSIYREKSQYATRLILDHLESRLLQEGISAAMATEVKGEFGNYDVTIVQGDPCLVLRGGEPKIRLEIKASLGLPLEQIDRYLWNPSPLIIVRVVTGHVVLLRPEDLEEFVGFSLRNILEKSKRMGQEKLPMVPGPHCTDCPDRGCPFNEPRRYPNPSMVKMNDQEFGTDLTSFFQHIPYVSKRTASLVVEELRRNQD